MGRRSGKTKSGAGNGGGTELSVDYHHWTTTRVEAGGQEVTVATKAGVPGHGALDAATGLLLDHVEIAPGESLLDLHCGAGALAAFALRHQGAGRVVACDRNLLAVQATRRTLAANEVSAAEVVFAPAPEPSRTAHFDAATIRLPLGRLPTLHQLWTAALHLRPGGRCYLAGANDEGIRTALRQMEEIFGAVQVLGYRGGNRAGLAIRPGTLPDSVTAHPLEWTDPDIFHHFTVETPAGPLAMRSRPGVFSWDRLDVGSRALLAAMRVEAGDRVLELGCGYGVVGVAAAALHPDVRATLVDVDSEAVRSARETAAANGLQVRVEVFASDGAAELSDRRFDVVLTNPPFHLEKGTNLALPERFIHDAAAVLRPGGRLFLVANRTLPYERWLNAAFGEHQVASDGREFKVLSAVARPLQPEKRR